MFINSSLLSHMNLMSACLFFIEGRVNPRPESGAALCVCKFDAAFREFYFLFIYFAASYFDSNNIYIFLIKNMNDWIFFLFVCFVVFVSAIYYVSHIFCSFSSICISLFVLCFFLHIYFSLLFPYLIMFNYFSLILSCLYLHFTFACFLVFRIFLFVFIYSLKEKQQIKLENRLFDIDFSVAW